MREGWLPGPEAALPSGAGVVSGTDFQLESVYTQPTVLSISTTLQGPASPEATVPWLQDAKEPLKGRSTHFMLGGKLFLLLILVLTEAMHVHY